MKFYLQPFLFFLLLFGWTGNGVAEENLTSEAPTSLPVHPDHQTMAKEHPDYSGNLYPEYPDIPEATPDHVEHESDTFQAKFLNMLFILALLIGFMILASWALKRLMRTKMSHLNTGSNIKVLETRYLSPRATLYLVDIQNQTILIAESPTTVTFLATIPQDSEQPSEAMKK